MRAGVIPRLYVPSNMNKIIKYYNSSARSSLWWRTAAQTRTKAFLNLISLLHAFSWIMHIKVRSYLGFYLLYNRSSFICLYMCTTYPFSSIFLLEINITFSCSPQLAVTSFPVLSMALSSWKRGTGFLTGSCDTEILIERKTELHTGLFLLLCSSRTCRISRIASCWNAFPNDLKWKYQPVFKLQIQITFV